MSLPDTLRLLINPSTIPNAMDMIRLMKDVAEVFPELAGKHPDLDKAVEDLLVVARKELDDTADVAKDLHQYFSAMLHHATEPEMVDFCLLLVLTCKKAKSLTQQ